MQNMNSKCLTEKIAATTHATIDQLLFSWSPRFAIVFGDAAPRDFTLSFSFAPGRLPNMQGCFALAIMIFAGFIAVLKDSQQAK
jgi:hypothetical protein